MQKRPACIVGCVFDPMLRNSLCVIVPAASSIRLDGLVSWDGSQPATSCQAASAQTAPTGFVVFEELRPCLGNPARVSSL